MTTVQYLVLFLTFSLTVFADPSVKHEPKKVKLLVLKAHFEDPNAIPEELMRHVSYTYDEQLPESYPNTFYITFINDNLGILSYVFEETIPKADDFGFTHGGKIGYSRMLWNDYKIDLSYSTDLYTSPQALIDKDGKESPFYRDGSVHQKVKQFFVNHDVINLVFESRKYATGFSWRFLSGIQYLNRTKEGNFFQAAEQQKQFHSLLNSFRETIAIEPYNFANGENEVRFNLGIGFSYDKRLINYYRNKLDLSVKNDFVFDNAGYFLGIDLQLKHTIRIYKDFQFGTVLGLNQGLHNNGSITTPRIGVFVGRDAWKVKFDIYQPIGKLRQNVDYNTPNRWGRSKLENDPFGVLGYEHRF